MNPASWRMVYVFTLLLMSASCYFFPRYALALTCFLSHSLSRLKPLLSLKDFYNNLTSLSLSISLLFQFSPVTQSCLTFYDPMDCSMPGFSTLHYLLNLLKFMSVVSVMPSNHLILSPPSPPAFNLSQHQGLFQYVSSSHKVAKVLELQHQHQSFQ